MKFSLESEKALMKSWVLVRWSDQEHISTRGIDSLTKQLDHEIVGKSWQNWKKKLAFDASCSDDTHPA